MGKIDWDRGYGMVYGITDDNARYIQDGKRFNGRGIEIDRNGNVVDPSDLIPDEPKEEKPDPINGKEPEFQRDWHKDTDPPRDYIGLTYDDMKNAPPEGGGSKCDECGFVAKSDFGLKSHKRFKHPK